MGILYNLRAASKRVRFVPLAIALFGFAALNSGTAFATTASMSPSYRSACWSATINFNLYWGGNAPFDAYFESDDAYGGTVEYNNVYYTSGSFPGAHYSTPDTYHPRIWSYDYGCGGLCGVGYSQGTVVITAGGPGCPQGPVRDKSRTSLQR